MLPAKDRMRRPPYALSIFLIFLPAVLFYGILFRKLIDLPFGDDYEILAFLEKFVQLHGTWARTAYVLTAQWNEYKLIFGHSIFALQYLLLGHISFIGLSFIGDLGVLLIAIALWQMFLPAQHNLSLRLLLFIPVSWMLFQLSYAETLNWAEPALQNLYILVFSFATFVALGGQKWTHFLKALLFMVLAIAASANGLITAAIGAVLLLKQRRFSKLLAWCIVTTAMIFLYFYRYNAGGGGGHRSAFAKFIKLRPAYILGFLGSLGEIGEYRIPYLTPVTYSIALGFVLLVGLGYLAFRGQLSANPAVNASIGFIVVTSVGVAGIRSDLDIAMSISSRYRIYCSMLLILVWFLVCEHRLLKTTKPLRRNWTYSLGLITAVMLCLAYDREGYRFLTDRDEGMIRRVASYEHPAIPVSYLDFQSTENQLHAPALLIKAEAEGMYRPPIR